MARLVVLSEGFTGLSHDLKGDKTTVGRVEENVFQVAEASVSSHHCEILKKGEDFVVRDLDSTNGTFINGEQVTESALKPGQILRLGQVEVRLEAGEGSPSASAAAAAKRPLEKTMVIPQGVNPTEFDQAHRPAVEASSGFSKKSNKINKIFIGIGIALGIIIIVALIIAAQKLMG